MARDECCDCEEFHPGGVGLKMGRCPGCFARWAARRKTSKAIAAAAEKKNKGA